MYSVDQNDEVVEIAGVPPSSAGAPMPVVLADGRRILLAYLVQERELWQTMPVHVAGSESTTELAALAEFVLPRAHLFGSPNDEALHGHPLYERGLRHYAAYEVRQSSWVRALERMNRVHPSHNPERFARLHHYVFTFHNSTFECVAEALHVTEHREPLTRLLAEMQRRLGS